MLSDNVSVENKKCSTRTRRGINKAVSIDMGNYYLERRGGPGMVLPKKNNAKEPRFSCQPSSNFPIHGISEQSSFLRKQHERHAKVRAIGRWQSFVFALLTISALKVLSATISFFFVTESGVSNGAGRRLKPAKIHAPFHTLRATAAKERRNANDIFISEEIIAENVNIFKRAEEDRILQKKRAEEDRILQKKHAARNKRVKQ